MKEVQHIVSAYDRELDDLQQKLESLCHMALVALDKSMHAIDKHDEALASEVRKNDNQLDQLEHEIDAEVMAILARRQPMAVDLRFLISILKISALLERVGDFAKNIAKRVPELETPNPADVMQILFQMSLQVRGMLADSLQAFFAKDMEVLKAVWAQDIDVDAHYSAVQRLLIVRMMENPRNITACTHLIFIAKNLERIGDHATNVAELGHFYITGEGFAEDRPKGASVLTASSED